MTGAPDPGEGFRLVDQTSEKLYPTVDYWNMQTEAWERRLYPRVPYQPDVCYRVPSDIPANTVSEPVPLRWPDIPVSDDAWFQQPEPDRDVDVAAWVLSAVMAVVLLLTGFILGWSWGE